MNVKTIWIEKADNGWMIHINTTHEDARKEVAKTDAELVEVLARVLGVTRDARLHALNAEMLEALKWAEVAMGNMNAVKFIRALIAKAESAS